MGHKVKLVMLICSGLCTIFYSLSYGGLGILERGNLSFMPGPRLLSPVTDDIDSSGKEVIEFRWLAGNLARTDYFDFRLYKGHKTTAAELIFKQRYSVHELPVKIPVSMFETDQVYAWVLIQVFLGGEKSDKSFSSFKIIKK